MYSHRNKPLVGTSWTFRPRGTISPAGVGPLLAIWICSKKIVILVTVCCALTLAAAIAPAQAAGRSRVLTIALFASGIGLKFGGVFAGKSAQDSYDQYLRSAIHANIEKHRGNYTGKQDLGVIMSRTGVGFVGLAVLISLFDGLDLISKSPLPESAALHLKPGYNPRTHEAALLFQGRF